MGRALSERELEEKAEQYRLFIKPLIDKLESIELNTQSRNLKRGQFNVVRYNAGIPGGMTVKLTPSTPYLFYLGLVTGGNFDQIVDSATTTLFYSYDSQLTLNKRIPLMPGMLIRNPTLQDIYISSTGGTTGFFTFIELNEADDFKEYLAGFRVSASGIISRPSLDSNLDQYVLFRTPPSVTIPDTTKVIVWDGASVMDVDGSGRISVNIAAQPIRIEEITGAPFHQTATAAAAAGVVMTIAPVSGDIRINYIDICCYNSAARVGGAAPVTCTISGFQDDAAAAVTLSYDFPSFGAIGTLDRLHIDGAKVMQAITSTNVVITCPATAGIKWKVDASYLDAV